MDYPLPVRFRSRILSRAVVVALLASASAGCTMERFGNSPLFTGATGGQRTAAAATAQPMPPALVANASPDDMGATAMGPSSRVTSSDLPPPPQSNYPAETATAWNDPGDTAISEPPARQSRQIGTTITIAEGDTLYSIARRAKVPVSAIAAANGLTTGSHLRTGQSLIVPSPDFPTAGRGEPPRSLGTIREGGAGGDQFADRGPSARPAERPRERAAAVETSTGEHVVKNGETMYSIAIAYRVTPTALADANGMTQRDTLRIGQRLTIPGGRRSSQTTVAAAPVEPVVRPTDPEERPVREARLTPPNQDANRIASDVVPAAPTVAVTPPQDTPRANAAPAQPVTADEPSTNGTTFRWPVRGRIISGFGAKPGGERNDGINLAVPAGTSVKAAEAGTVIYAGNEIAGYGNLILIRHTGGWVTAYAHNSETLVSRGDTIQRGQIIAKAGSSGSVSSPQVHFELRKGQTPVNPLDYLSGA